MTRRIHAGAVLLVLILLPLLAGASGAAHPGFISLRRRGGSEGEGCRRPVPHVVCGSPAAGAGNPFPNGPSLSQQDLGEAARALRTKRIRIRGERRSDVRPPGQGVPAEGLHLALLAGCGPDRTRAAGELHVGTFQGSVAETYDWIYPLLTAEERARSSRHGDQVVAAFDAQHGSDMEAQDFGTKQDRPCAGRGRHGCHGLKDDLPGNTAVSSAATIAHDTPARGVLRPV